MAQMHIDLQERRNAETFPWGVCSTDRRWRSICVECTWADLSPWVDTGKTDHSCSDVAPVLRRFFTRADDCFDDRLSLTLCDKLTWGQVSKRAVRTAGGIVHSPGFDDRLGLGQRGELMHIQALIPQPSVQ